ncbi:MAG: phBC6A51 family helix-turn-helix protein [Syntrophomonadaceae bacterium]|nr:phBC6A51 family helix-turn-helix protein [Syntrophomonadaceae bacterium]
MLDQRKIKLIELIIEGSLNKTQMAEQIGVSRQCMYEWMGQDEWIAEYDRRLQEIKTNANKLFNAKLNNVIDEWYRMMMDESCEKRTRAKLMVDWVDRSLGKATSRLEVTENKPEEYNDPLEDINDNEIKELKLIN